MTNTQTDAARRRERLAELLTLARAYREWSQAELARALGRDPSKIIPVSGIPKLDLVTRLADVLDWSIEDVVTVLELPEGEGSPSAEGAGFTEFQTASRKAWVEGRYTEAATIAERAYAVAATPDERALACVRGSVAWIALGQVANPMEMLQRGLREISASRELRLILQSNLANLYYTNWQLVEARALANELIQWYAQNPAEDHRSRATEAFAYYVHGNALRRLATTGSTKEQRTLEEAKCDLENASNLYSQLVTELDDETYAAIAHTCAGGIIEIDVELEHLQPRAALDRITKEISGADDTRCSPPGEWPESYGWWCVFGCNIARRHIPDNRELQRYLVLFTERADEIARRTDSWPLRERLFTIEERNAARLHEMTGRRFQPVLDTQDLRALIGTIARFPAFRQTGLKLLRQARIVQSR
ncbi:MAG: helix-turn-helix transcriptional regulator [Planctomycetota bacterium]|nr:helix-turn-helix transcriptional regulator [Planctomycetota bacterium]